LFANGVAIVVACIVPLVIGADMFVVGADLPTIGGFALVTNVGLLC